jgi:hypothetical protein
MGFILTMMLLYYTFKECEEFYNEKYPEFVYILLFSSVMVFLSYWYPPPLKPPSIGVFVDTWKLYVPDEQLRLQCALCVLKFTCTSRILCMRRTAASLMTKTLMNIKSQESKLIQILKLFLGG